MFNVPRGYIRYLSWNLFVIPNDERTPAVNVSGETSYSAYYAQAQADTEGYEMLTKIPVHEVKRIAHLLKISSVKQKSDASISYLMLKKI